MQQAKSSKAQGLRASDHMLTWEDSDEMEKPTKPSKQQFTKDLEKQINRSKIYREEFFLIVLCYSLIKMFMFKSNKPNPEKIFKINR